MDVMKIETWIEEFSEKKVNLDKLQEYLDFIKEAVERYDPERYSEWHHVMPRCVDKDSKYTDQGVRINGADHLRAHCKLVDCFNGQLKYKMSSALSWMKLGDTKGDISSEEWEEIREKSRKFNISKLEEIKAKMSANHADFKGKNHPMYGVYQYGKDNPFYGKSILKSQRERFQKQEY